MSVSPKGKRKHIYNNETYYWFVRKNSEGIPRIHIISDDKKIKLERAMYICLQFQKEKSGKIN